MGSLEKMKWMIYRQMLERRLEGADGGLGRGCGPTLIVCLSLFLVISLSGCRLWKQNVKESSETSDSVRVEYRERVVKVPVTVYVEVPVEVRERISNDTLSHLETSFAVSDASIVWIDGVAFLRHSLANKPQKIAKQDSVPVVEKETIQWKTRRVTYSRTEIREKQLTWWQKGLMYMGVAFIIALIILVFLFTKSKLLRR